MFGKKSDKSIPDEFITSHEAWEGYVASIWYDLLMHYGLTPEDTLIEIAPGSSSKIGLALERTSFEGVLYLVDPLSCALESVTDKYKRYLPKATIYSINATLEDALDLLPREPDFLLANHPLDDMLLATISDSVTPDLFICTSNRHRDHRLRLEGNPTIAISEVVSCWQQALNKLLPKATILCQYPSLILRQNDIHSLNIYAEEIMESLKACYPTALEPSYMLQKLLNEHENYNDVHIGTEVLNAKNWMVLREVVHPSYPTHHPDINFKTKRILC